MAEAKRAYLGIGSNLGDRASNIRAAIARLEAHPGIRVVRESSVYETRPVGVPDQPDFLNAVVEVETTLGPRELLAASLRIEQELGRVRTMRWGPRVIDLDILTYDGAREESEDLTLPHPRMQERAFVLVPLVEIAPGLQIANGLSAEEALARLPDDQKAEVRKRRDS